MNSRRLYVLVAVMAALALARSWIGWRNTETTVQPVLRSEPAGAIALASVQTPVPTARTESSAEEDDSPGNAFVARVAAPPAAAAAPAPLPPVSPAFSPPLPLAAPPPPAPPPLQVIGTYDDGTGAAVFFATPGGTLLARAGTIMLAEYQVTAITAQHVALKQLSSQRTFEVPFPGPAR